MFRSFSRNLFAVALIIVLCAAIAGCRDARAPAPQKTEPVAQVEGPLTEEESGVVIYPPMPLDAGLSGREFSFEDLKFTHFAVSADDQYEYLVKVNVTVNDEFAGSFYADGWEDEAPQKMRIGPGDTTVWLTKRGVWNHYPEENVMKLAFTMEGIGGMETPARYFKGMLHLKYDPAADVEPEESELRVTKENAEKIQAAIEEQAEKQD